MIHLLRPFDLISTDVYRDTLFGTGDGGASQPDSPSGGGRELLTIAMGKEDLYSGYRD